MQQPVAAKVQDWVSRGASVVMNDVDKIGGIPVVMKALLDDLLDHSKLEAGRMTVDEADFDPRVNLREKIANMASVSRFGAVQTPAECRKDQFMNRPLPQRSGNPLPGTRAGACPTFGAMRGGRCRRNR